jgi:adenosine deaminase CECR1
MCFTLAKERMESTMLWKIVKKFPKGALLHAHLEAMVDSEWHGALVFLRPAG